MGRKPQFASPAYKECRIIHSHGRIILYLYYTFMRVISKARFIPESRHSSHKPKAFPPELYIRFLTSSIASPRLPHCILPNILRICVLTVFSLIKRSSAIFAFVCSKEKARRISSSRSVKPKSLFTACSAVSKSDVSEFSPVTHAARAGLSSGAIIPI